MQSKIDKINQTYKECIREIDKAYYICLMTLLGVIISAVGIITGAFVFKSSIMTISSIIVGLILCTVPFILMTRVSKTNSKRWEKLRDEG